MAKLIKAQKTLSEGEFLNKWIRSRLMDRNQNIIIAVTGSTGSGKSYTCLRILELWYKFQFNKTFSANIHVCFSISEVIKLLTSNTLKRGDIIILEEAGVNFSNLDFQNKVSKLFGFVLQSFRSLNIGLVMNLPVLTMLNKSARQLIHLHLTTCGIDFKTNTSKVKPLFHQLNQQSGQSYWKFPRARINNKVMPIKRLNYNLPSEIIVKAYEIKKLKFITDLTEDFSSELDKLEKDKIKKNARKDLSFAEEEVFNLLMEGYNQAQISETLKKSTSSVWEAVGRIKKKGYAVPKVKMARKTEEIKDIINIPAI